jgi:Syd protein (SUKH-2)
MKIKTILSEYFKWYENVNEEDLPQTTIFENSDPLIYVGEVVDGWVRWKPSEKKEQYDFREIEENLNIRIHESVKEYYNSYWFCSLLIDYQDLEIEMYPVVPGNYIRAFLSSFLGYINAHNGLLTHIPIGFDTKSASLIVIDNSNGRIQIENYEDSTLEEIAPSLYTLLSDGN